MNSRQKGAAGERELAKVLREYGFEHAKRGQQFSGANGDADIVDALPGIHIECKRVEKLNIENAMKQAKEDSYADSLKSGREMLPAVFHRKNRCEWLVTMTLKDWIKIYKGATQ